MFQCRSDSAPCASYICSKTNMIKFESFQLENGLKVIVHEDHSTPMAAVNLLYDVGSRDESEDKTGFAHLFEHLMFGGSKNIPQFDTPLQLVGGDNNAFTTPDITNYYINLPAVNLETAFWLESDRMLSLSFDPKVLEVQRSVVIEEFKQRYLNQPYGDLWLKLRPVVYTSHPYSWPTIGKDISHIEQATMADVEEFFYKFYRPNNATLVVAGQVTVEQVKRLSEKWFGGIPAGPKNQRLLPVEPAQLVERRLEIEADVPLDAIYKVFRMPERLHSDYYAIDLMNDILGKGRSSMLYNDLVKQDQVFNSISAYASGSFDPGLIVVGGKLNEGVTLDYAESRITEVLDNMKAGINDTAIEKTKNQAQASHAFSEIELLNRAMFLAMGDVLGDANMINEELAKIDQVTAYDIKSVANKYLVNNSCTTMHYKAKK
ncbi:peptidase M16 [Persicobacter psychrovividus]|uniref:Peptidase M16 n=2 Tax=Persicobacter psychrovividus TaxID=387638 RepID=A0ABN6L4L1_9BACT|nr:peptidase M16 [Persicobacter psychrovividus]